jgi:hypothetical protein
MIYNNNIPIPCYGEVLGKALTCMDMFWGLVAMF